MERNTVNSPNLLSRKKREQGIRNKNRVRYRYKVTIDDATSYGVTVTITRLYLVSAGVPLSVTFRMK